MLMTYAGVYSMHCMGLLDVIKVRQISMASTSSLSLNIGSNQQKYSKIQLLHAILSLLSTIWA